MKPDRRTRKSKAKRYETRNGTRCFFEGYAFLELPPPGRWVTAKGGSAEEAKYKAMRKADLVEAEYEAGLRKAEAEARNQELAAALDRQRALNMTIAEVIEEYQQYVSDLGRADSTLDKYGDHLNVLRGIQIASLECPVAEWRLGAMIGKGFAHLQRGVAADLRSASPNTVRARWSFLSAVLTYAKNVGYIDENPMALVKLPPRQLKGELEVTVDQVASLMAVASNDAPMSAGLALAFTVGGRRQEIVGLTGDDIKPGKLKISRQLARVNWDGEDGPRDSEVPTDARYGRTAKGRTLVLKKPKASRQTTTYEISAAIEGLLYRSLDTAKPTTIWDAVDAKWRTVWFVVHAPEGYAQEGQHFADRYRQLCRQHGVGGVLHDLRALFASDAAVKEVPVEIISKLLRHGDLATTQIYLRGLKQVVGKVSRALSESATEALGLRGT